MFPPFSGLVTAKVSVKTNHLTAPVFTDNFMLHRIIYIVLIPEGGVMKRSSLFFLLSILILNFLIAETPKTEQTASMEILKQAKSVEAVFNLCGFKFKQKNPMRPPPNVTTTIRSLSSVNAGNVTIRKVKPEHVSVAGNRITFKDVPDGMLGKQETVIAVLFSADFTTVEELTVSKVSKFDDSSKSFSWKLKDLKGGKITLDEWKTKKIVVYSLQIPYEELSRHLMELTYTEKSNIKKVDYDGVPTSEELTKELSKDDIFNMTRPDIQLTFKME